jgi:hypothetical protein
VRNVAFHVAVHLERGAYGPTSQLGRFEPLPTSTGMAAICAFETFAHVSNRRLADVADSGLGRLNWADSAHTGVTSRRTGVGALAAIRSRPRRLPPLAGRRTRPPRSRRPRHRSPHPRGRRPRTVVRRARHPRRATSRLGAAAQAEPSGTSASHCHAADWSLVMP